MMITVTLHEAKAKLNHLVEQACLGKQVVLMRGAEVVATILPLSSDDIEISPFLTDSQAKKFWDEVSSVSSSKKFRIPKKAVEFLKNFR